MAESASPEFRNRILANLSGRELDLLKPHLRPIDLSLRERLEVANKTIGQVFFLEDGLGSVVALSSRGRKQAELAVIGNEGMTGSAVLLGAKRSPNDTFMQVAGAGHSLETENLLQILSRSPALYRRLLMFVHVLMIQAGQTVLANALGSIEERLSRWLLMSQDRIRRDDLQLTHDYIALMLGVRRPGVSIGLQRLEQAGLISTRRGAIQIVDREGLVEKANGYYGVPEAEYERLFPKSAVQDGTRLDVR